MHARIWLITNANNLTEAWCTKSRTDEGVESEREDARSSLENSSPGVIRRSTATTFRESNQGEIQRKLGRKQCGGDREKQDRKEAAVKQAERHRKLREELQAKRNCVDLESPAGKKGAEIKQKAIARFLKVTPCCYSAPPFSLLPDSPLLFLFLLCSIHLVKSSLHVGRTL